MNVLLTGASSGIGRGLLIEYLRRGAAVFTLSRRAPKLPEPVVARLDSAPSGTHRFRSIDLSAGAEEIRVGLYELLEGERALDLVILNAGILGRFGDLSEASVEDLAEVMRVNVWANKLILDELLEKMSRVDQVVAISSGASVSGARGWSGYGISKAALNMMVELYAAERPDTHFCALAPGLVDTAMQEFLRTAPIDETQYPTVARLRGARHTDTMPLPEVAALRLVAAFEKVRFLPSGAYADLRKL